MTKIVRKLWLCSFLPNTWKITNFKHFKLALTRRFCPARTRKSRHYPFPRREQHGLSRRSERTGPRGSQKYEDTCEWAKFYSHCQSIMAAPTLNPNVVASSG